MDEKTNKRVLAWLSAAHFANDTYSGFLNPIMPFIAAKIGFSMAIATVIMAIAQVCASMIQPIFGFFADNMVKRSFIFWGLILSSIFIPFAPMAPSLVVLTLFVILGFLGGSLFHPQSLGFISKFSHMNFTYNMGLFITAGTIGFSVGPMVSGVMAQLWGFDKIPYTGLVGLIIALLMFKFVPKMSGTSIKIEQKDFKDSFKKVLSNKYMLILMVISMMKSLVTNSAMILLPFLWKNMGYKPSHIGIILFLFLLFGGVGSLLSERFEKRFGAKKVFYLSMIATFPIMALFVATYRTHPTFSIVVFVLMGFITMLAVPVTMVMAQRILPDYKSIVSGFINGFSWGIVAIFLTIVGFSAQAFGIAKVLLIVSFIPAIFSYLVKFLPENVGVNGKS